MNLAMTVASQSEDSHIEDEYTSSSDLHADLLNRAQLLLADLEAFQTYLRSENKENAVDLRQFQSSVQSENKSLERINAANSNEPSLNNQDAGEVELKRVHVLRSSNLPFYEAVWTAAGQFKAVTAIEKKISFNQQPKQKNLLTDGQVKHFSSNSTAKGGWKADSILADIIADEGQTWVKVSTITEKRLLFEMAKEGWERYDASEDDTEWDLGSEELSAGTHREGANLEVVRLAENMKKAASTVRVRYRHPQIYFVLARITEGRLAEIDAVIDKLRMTGVRVHCAVQGHYSSNGVNRSYAGSPNHTGRFSSMLPKGHPPLTSTLNIDCTILLALISDISHLRAANLPPAPNGSYHSAIMRQIRAEVTTQLLTSELYPLLAGHQLHCTRHAAQRMREIVWTMGTAAEKERAEILLGEGHHRGRQEAGLRSKLEELSDYEVPAGLRLPLTVVEFDNNTHPVEDQSSPVNRMMLRIAPGLSEINKSVFFYGWSRRIITISSNRAVAKEIEQSVCHLFDEEAEQRWNVSLENITGPDILVCRTARSLIGKEKGRLDN